MGNDNLKLNNVTILHNLKKRLKILTCESVTSEFIFLLQLERKLSIDLKRTARVAGDSKKKRKEEEEEEGEENEQVVVYTLLLVQDVGVETSRIAQERCGYSRINLSIMSSSSEFTRRKVRDNKTLKLLATRENKRKRERARDIPEVLYGSQGCGPRGGVMVRGNKI